MTLLVLSAAALLVCAALASALIGAALPALDGVSARLSAPGRATFWALVAAAPLAAAAILLFATFLPAMGLGADHCLAHGPHHPHLCPHHAAGGPALGLVGLAGLLGLRLVVGLLRGLSVVITGRAAAARLASAADREGDVLVFPSAEPQAFVLGLWSPQIFASRGLMEHGASIVDPVLHHERAHARRRDSLLRTIAGLLGAGHLPGVSGRVKARLRAAQERAADDAAARAVGDPVLVAEALVAVARGQPTPGGAFAFTEGDLEGRVRALLAPPRPSSRWLPGLLASAALVTGGATLALSDPIHHALETALGVFG